MYGVIIIGVLLIIITAISIYYMLKPYVIFSDVVKIYSASCPADRIDDSCSKGIQIEIEVSKTSYFGLNMNQLMVTDYNKTNIFTPLTPLYLLKRDINKNKSIDLIWNDNDSSLTLSSKDKFIIFISATLVYNPIKNYTLEIHSIEYDMIVGTFYWRGG